MTRLALVSLGVVACLALWFAREPAAPPGLPAGPPPRDSVDESIPISPGAATSAGASNPRRRAHPTPSPSGPSIADDGSATRAEFNVDGWLDDLEEEIATDQELLKRAGLPADTPLALRIGRFGPPDPLELGRAELHLTLRDQATGEPIDGEVVLWRLSAPANVYWTAGDQDVAWGSITREGFRFTGLPSGEYRPVVLDERAAAPHHAPLHVSGRTVQELFVRTPRQRPVRIVVRGEPSSVEARFQGQRRHPRAHVPPWVAARTIQPDFDDVLEFEMMEDELWSTEPTWIPLVRTELGYDAGTLPEDTRHARVTRKVTVRVDGVTHELALGNPPSGDDAILVFRLE